MELDKIVIPQLPSINQLINYRTELAAALATASGRYDCKEIGWFEAIMVVGKSFDYLAESGGAMVPCRLSTSSSPRD